ncbi:hypothetical protein C8R47DRAFT_1274060 [Mycena vitilis]|nr:hypothetical protein C8R47DRAFT_1274060 [Mycena vitilis]
MPLWFSWLTSCNTAIRCGRRPMGWSRVRFPLEASGTLRVGPPNWNSRGIVGKARGQEDDLRRRALTMTQLLRDTFNAAYIPHVTRGVISSNSLRLGLEIELPYWHRLDPPASAPFRRAPTACGGKSPPSLANEFVGIVLLTAIVEDGKLLHLPANGNLHLGIGVLNDSGAPRDVRTLRTCSGVRTDTVAKLSASALGRLSETVFGNPSRDFTLVDNPGAPIERQAGYSYPQSVGRGVGLLVLFEGVFGGPYSDRDRRSTTLEGAEGRRYLGRRGKGGLVQGKSLSPTDRVSYAYRVGEELWISRAIGGVGKEFLSPCMPSEIRLSGFHDNPGVIVEITRTFHDSPGGAVDSPVLGMRSFGVS